MVGPFRFAEDPLEEEALIRVVVGHEHGDRAGDGGLHRDTLTRSVTVTQGYRSGKERTGPPRNAVSWVGATRNSSAISRRRDAAPADASGARIPRASGVEPPKRMRPCGLEGRRAGGATRFSGGPWTPSPRYGS